MQPGLSTHVFFQHRLHPGLLDALAAAGTRSGAASSAGASGGAASKSKETITIEVFAARHHFDYTDTPAVRELASWFRSNDVRAVLHQPIYMYDGRMSDGRTSNGGMGGSRISDGGAGGRAGGGEPGPWSRHVAPNLDLIAPEKTHRIAAMDEVKRALESAEQVPFQAVVVSLGLKDTPWDDAAIERSLTAIEHLKAFAAPLGVRLLLENMENEVTTPDHLLYILRAGHFDSAGVCLDVGHLHLGMPAHGAPRDSGVGAAVELLGSRIAQVHLHDNHGAFSDSTEMKDEHLWPGEGTIDWAAVTASLAKLPAETPGILEATGNREEPADAVTRKAEKALRMFAAAEKPA